MNNIENFNNDQKKLNYFDLLKHRHKMFVYEYIRLSMNGKQAYLKVYPGVSDATAEVNSCRLLRNAKIKIAIEETFSRIWKDKDSDLECLKTLNEINSIAFSNIFDVITVDNGKIRVRRFDEIPEIAKHAVQSMDIVEKETSEGIDRKISLRMHSKISALESRAKIQQLIGSNKKDDPIDIVIIPAERPQRKLLRPLREWDTSPENFEENKNE